MTDRFIKRAGEPSLQSTEDPAMWLLGDPVPDWIGLPEELHLGDRVTVDAASMKPCPKCGEGPVRHLHFHVQEQKFGVAECTRCGFVWYRDRRN